MSETAISQESIYRARPTLRFAGEEDIRASELILAMRMEENEGGMSTLELRLSNVASTTDGGAELGLRRRLEAQTRRRDRGLRRRRGAAARDLPRPCHRDRSGLQDGIAARAHRARRRRAGPRADGAAQQDLSRTWRRPTWRARSPATLSLRPVIAGLDSPTGTWAQINESDLAFLRRLLARFDADVQVVGEELHVSPRGDVRRGGIELPSTASWRARE